MVASTCRQECKGSARKELRTLIAESDKTFTWVDGDRLIRFGRGVVAEAPDLLAARGFERYALITTERAEAESSALVQGAEVVLHAASGSVPDIAAALRPRVGGHSLVALGGGRVVDAAKAIAGADGLDCAAIPTTLAGSPVTPFHRMPVGVTAGRLVRPRLVVWDPDLIAGLPERQLAATAMNALAHAFESTYTPLANPVSELAALRGAELIGCGLGEEPVDRVAVSLGALLGGYAVGSTGFAVHHALCQTIVRTAGTPHAETNAVMLPHTVDLMAHRAPEPVGRFSGALGDPSARAVNASARVARLTAQTGVEGLRQLGLDEDGVADIVDAVGRHPGLAATPGGAPAPAELDEVIRAAL